MAERGGVLVTGASTGIGRACALELHRLGYRVFAGVRKPADGERLVAAASERLTPVILDVTRLDTITAAAAEIDAALGATPLVGIVNNAGVGVGGPLEYLPLGDLKWQFEVNVFGQMAVTQAFLPRLRASRGRIVNIGSIGGRVSQAFMGPYCASKFALSALTFSLREELRPWGVQATIIEPGAIQSDIWDKADASVIEAEQALSAEARTRYGKAMEAMKRMFARQRRHAIPALRVVEKVVIALEAPTIKARYLPGREAKMVAFFRWLLPDAWLEAMIRKALGL
jgi:NAD(P)-dependent dehydrogenase (short-subunit alcohol dehydrogenase family)